MQKDKPRVLVISHNAFSKVQNNGKTLESFFKAWDTDLIAQLFFQTDIPDYDYCDNYFNINDYDLLNSFLFRKTPGKILKRDKDNTEEYGSIVGNLYDGGKDKNNRKGLNRIVHKLQAKKLPILSAVRSLVWAGERWKTNELLSWIENFNPQVVFFQGSSCYFVYKLVLWVCKYYNLPLILELTDDYTVPFHSFSLIDRIQIKKYIKYFGRAVTQASKVITICDYMADEYRQRFGGEYISLLNSVPAVESTQEDDLQVRFLYAGNVEIQRYKVLCNIGKALTQINLEKGSNIWLDIFTPAGTPKEILNKFNKIPAINYGGSLTTEELREQVKKSNYLVHVESFNKQMQKITRLSLSTKIPEYLASHRCIYAVGPKKVSSMRYLIDNDAAFTTTDNKVSAIKKDILRMLDSSVAKKQKKDNQSALYHKFHESDKTQTLISDIVINAVTKSSRNPDKV